MTSNKDQGGGQPLLSLSNEEVSELEKLVDSNESTTKPPLYLKVIEAMESLVIPFIGDDGAFYVDVNKNGTRWTYPLSSPDFKRYMISEFRKKNKTVLFGEVFDRVKVFFEAEAYESKAVEVVGNRVKFYKGVIYYDLHNENAEVVKITSNGWEILTNPPVRFPRRQLSLPNVLPVSSGNISILRKYINVKDDEQWYLIASTILNYCYHPPHPLLSITGQQGSSKSTIAKVISEIVDPSKVPINSSPRDERELFIMALNSHLLNFDNLSRISAQTADTFCRLVTGAGFRARQLYSDDSEKMIYASNPIIGNGIEEISDRGDMIDRMVHIRLPPIHSSKRNTESVFWEQFEHDRPLIMGGVFNALSIALRNLPRIHLVEKPRMADFAIFACASAEAIGIEQGTFMNAYLSNIKESNRNTLELDPVAIAIQNYINLWKEEKSEWIGTMTELLAKLSALVPNEQRNRHFPSAPQALSIKMKRLVPMLYSIQIGFEQMPRGGGTGSRLYRLYKLHPQLAPALEVRGDSDDCDDTLKTLDD